MFSTSKHPKILFCIPGKIVIILLFCFNMFFRPVLLTANPTGLVITEIMYNPKGEDSNPAVADLEFIEVHNRGPVVFDISGYRIEGGIEYTFPPDTYIPAHGYLAIAANAELLKQQYENGNIIGNFTSRLDNRGETIKLCLRNGGPICTVTYNDRGKWPSGADGTGHSLILKSPYSDPGKAANWIISPQAGGSPGEANFPEAKTIDHVLIPPDAYWHYKKGNAPPSSPVTAWRQIDFDDSSWSIGQTGIGYGDSDDTTVLSDMRNNYVTFAARKTFTIDDLDSIHETYLKISYDDGFIAYLNGTEVARSNVGSTAYDQVATGSHEAGGFEFFPITNNLREGTNVLACQIHNVNLTSSDSSFIPSLINRENIIPQDINIPKLVINEIRATGDSASFVEIKNNSDTTVSLEGFKISSNFQDAYPYVFSPGSEIGPQELLLIPGADLPFVLNQGEVRLFFTTGTDLVIDARIFDTRGIEFSQARYPDGQGNWIYSHKPTPGEPNIFIVEDGIVINEIMYCPITNNDKDEYIELYNRTNRIIDLSGCAFDKGISFLFPEGVSMRAGSYLVIAADRAHLIKKYDLNQEIVLGNYTGRLDDGGELIRLVDKKGNPMDQVRYYDGGRWPELGNGLGSSIELVDPYQDNNIPNAWAASKDMDKSSWIHVIYSGSCPRVPRESELHLLLFEKGECLVDNLKIQRNGINENYIPNGDFESSDMSRWRGVGTHIFSYRTLNGSKTGSGSLHIIATGRGNNRANFVEVDTSPSLQSGINYIISYDAKWLRGCNLLHTRGFEFGLMNTARLPLPSKIGTPGSQNSTWKSNTGPLIYGVTQDPVIPGTNQMVKISAMMSDNDGVDSAKLFYTTQRPQNFQSIAMFDDGNHGDGRANDGLWTGTIPGFALKTKVLFYIESKDTSGFTRTLPGDAPTRTCLYQVDSPIQSDLYVYRLILDDDNTDEIQNRLLHSNQLLDGTFIFGNSEIHYNVGIRYRGSPWQRRGNPKMFRISMNKDEPFHGIKKFNLSKYGNKQNERAAYYTIRENGGPSSFQFYVRFHYNGNHYYTAEHIQPVNKNWLKLWWPGDPDGNLYKVSARHKMLDDGSTFVEATFAKFDYIGDNQDDYRWNFLPRTNEEEDDLRELINLCKKMDPAETSNSEFDHISEDLIDTNEWIRMHAMRVVNDDWDTIGVRNGQNAYIYYAPIEGRWKLLPWDVDHTFGNVNASLFPTPDPGIKRFLQRPRYSRFYYRLLSEMISSFYTVDHMSKILDPTYEVLGTEAGGSANPQGIKTFITQRTQRIIDILPSSPSELRITTNNGSPFETDQENTTISGEAPIEVASILLKGEEVALSWSTTTKWSTTVQLSPGLNTLQFFAYDGFGTFTDSKTIVVTSTVQWPAPEITSITPETGRTAGGNLVNIKGSNFNWSSRVFFGETEVDITYQAESLLKAITPPGNGEVFITVKNGDGQEAISPSAFTYSLSFIRGDVNADTSINIADPIDILGYLFSNQDIPCQKAADVNDDGNLDISDSISLLSHLFNEADMPPPPSSCGLDPTGDKLSCEEFDGCR